jgi:hypothetical protein
MGVIVDEHDELGDEDEDEDENMMMMTLMMPPPRCMPLHQVACVGAAELEARLVQGRALRPQLVAPGWTTHLHRCRRTLGTSYVLIILTDDRTYHQVDLRFNLSSS